MLVDSTNFYVVMGPVNVSTVQRCMTRWRCLLKRRTDKSTTEKITLNITGVKASALWEEPGVRGPPPPPPPPPPDGGGADVARAWRKGAGGPFRIVH